MKEEKSDNTFEELYKQLNPEQRKAVDTIEGPVVVSAGPGTGKTQMLALRIANILSKSGAGVDPENILALTFTNAGVRAMRERLTGIIGPEAAFRTQIFTFHSFCQEHIESSPEDFPQFYRGRVADDVLRTTLVENILKTGSFDYLTTFASDGHYVRDVLSAIDELKREGITPKRFTLLIDEQEKNELADDDNYYKRNGKGYQKGDLKKDALKNVHKNKELNIVYEKYQEALAQQKLYDFADMIVAVVEKAETDESFRARLEEQYLYILVDEHQDTNDAQNRLLLALGSAEHLNGKPNIFAVGDAKQSIYRFQGASVENFQNFKENFSDVTEITLENNYRSTQNILDPSHAVISASGNFGDEKLKAKKEKDGSDPRVLSCQTYDDELHAVVSDIKKHIDRGTDPREIALFYRNNAHLDQIAAVCEKHAVPYVVASVQNALTDQVMGKLFLLLRALADPMRSDALAKAMLLDFVDLNTLDVLALLHRHARGRKKMPLAMLARDEKILKSVGITKLAQFKKFMECVEASATKGENTQFDLFLEEVTRQSGFLEYILKQNNHVELMSKLTRVFSEIRTLMHGTQSFTLRDFLVKLDAMESYGIALDTPWDQNASGIRLMTAHASKGLEFDHVYITNAVEGVWGKRRSMQKFHLPIARIKGDVEDERRLFYVAMTRARKYLTISYSSASSEGKEHVATRFVSELLDSHISEEHCERAAGENMLAERSRSVPGFLAPEYLREQFFARSISASMLNNYYQSPLLYFFRDIVKLPAPEMRALMFGNLVHGALEDFFGAVSGVGTLGTLEDLKEYFSVRLDRALMLHDEYERFQRRGEEALTAYWEQHSSSFLSDVLVEEWVSGIPFTLDSGEIITLVGKIDKMEIVSGSTIGGQHVRVIDYKTGTPWSKQTKEGREKLTRQMTFYKLLLDGYAEGKYAMEEAALHFVEPNKDGVCEVYTFSPTVDDVKKLKEEINTFATDVLSENFMQNIDIKKTRDTEQLIPLWNALNTDVSR